MCALLLADPRVDPSTDNNFPIRTAAASGNLEIVKMLLAHPKVDPLTQYSYPLLASIRYTHEEMALLLLSDDRVREWICSSSSESRVFTLFSTACEKGMFSVLRILSEIIDFTDENNIPNDDFSYSLSQACSEGHIEIVHFLLKLPKVKVTEEHLLACLSGGSVEMFETLLEKIESPLLLRRQSPVDEKKKREEPEAVKETLDSSILATAKEFCSAALKIVCSRGHRKLERYLIENFEIEVTSRHLNKACRKGHKKIVDDLKTQVKISQRELVDLFCVTCAGGHLEIAMMMIEGEIPNEKTGKVPVTSFLSEEDRVRALTAVIEETDNTPLVLALIDHGIGNHSIAFTIACANAEVSVVGAILTGTQKIKNSKGDSEFAEEDPESAEGTPKSAEGEEVRRSTFLTGDDLAEGLTEACLHGAIDIVDWLLSPPFNTQLNITKKKCLLTVACSSGNVEIVKKLLTSKIPRFDPCAEDFLAIRCLPIPKKNKNHVNYKIISRLLRTQACWQKLGIFFHPENNLGFPPEIFVIIASKFFSVLKKMSG